MATVKAVLYKDRKRKNGGYALVIQVIHKRLHRAIYTSIVLMEEEFDAKAEKVIYTDSMRFNHKQVNEMNGCIVKKKNEVETVVANFVKQEREFSIQELIDEYLRSQNKSYLVTFTEELIEKRTQSERIGQARAFYSTLCSIKKWAGDRFFLFNEITHQLVQEYRNFLLDAGLKENTVSFYMRNFRVIYNTALDSGVVTEDCHPFYKMHIRHGRTVKRALEKDVIEQIANLDLSDTPEVERARDLFMFSFYARGMCFVDIIYLRKTEIISGIIYYKRHKTHRRMQVAIVPKLQAIIDKYPSDDEYLFPFLNSTNHSSVYKRYLIAYGDIYRNLRKIEEMLGLSVSLTVHVARHSWATIAKAEGAPIEAIRMGLGHESERTTEIYLKDLDTSVIDELNEKVVCF